MKTKEIKSPPKKHAEHWKEVKNFSNIEGTLLNGKIGASEAMANMYVNEASGEIIKKETHLEGIKIL